MFTLDFIDILGSITRRKDNADCAIRHWKAENGDEYSRFKARIGMVAKGDCSVLEDMLALMKGCVPPEALAFYGFLADFAMGKVPAEALLKNKVLWAGRHTQTIAECIANRQMWLGISIKTGEVGIYAKRRHDMVMVNSNTPIEIWNRMPQATKAWLQGQLDKVTRNSKGKLMFSRLERKELYHMIALFSRIIVMAHATFISGFMANLYDVVIERKEPLAYCMYHFVVFDHGLTRMAQVLDAMMGMEGADTCCITLAKACVGMMVGYSIESGVENKAGWEGTADRCSPEIWKDIMYAVRKAKPQHLHRKSISAIDELLVGDKAVLKASIKDFLAENTEDISLAYLLFVLVMTGHVKASVRYMAFHRAVEQFAGRSYGFYAPQKRYGNIKEFSMKQQEDSPSYKKAQGIIERWTPVFSS